MNSHKWLVAYTTPRAEKKIEEQLTKNGITCYLPLHLSKRQWSDRIKYVEIPLFPSYIFIYTEETNMYSLLSSIRGLVKFVYYNSKAAELSQKEIDDIKEFLELSQKQSVEIKPLQEVEIEFGSFKGKTGIVKQVRKKKILLVLKQLGITVETNIEMVKPVKKEV